MDRPTGRPQAVSRLRGRTWCSVFWMSSTFAAHMACKARPMPAISSSCLNRCSTRSKHGAHTTHQAAGPSAHSTHQELSEPTGRRSFTWRLHPVASGCAGVCKPDHRAFGCNQRPQHSPLQHHCCQLLLGKLWQVLAATVLVLQGLRGERSHTRASAACPVCVDK